MGNSNGILGDIPGEDCDVIIHQIAGRIPGRISEKSLGTVSVGIPGKKCLNKTLDKFP